MCLHFRHQSCPWEGEREQSFADLNDAQTHWEGRLSKRKSKPIFKKFNWKERETMGMLQECHSRKNNRITFILLLNGLRLTTFAPSVMLLLSVFIYLHTHIRFFPLDCWRVGYTRRDLVLENAPVFLKGKNIVLYNHRAVVNSLVPTSQQIYQYISIKFTIHIPILSMTPIAFPCPVQDLAQHQILH